MSIPKRARSNSPPSILAFLFCAKRHTCRIGGFAQG
jgi:hypothetical protein